MAKTVIISGAAGAVGSAASRVFFEAGWQMVLLDVNESRLEAQKELYPGARIAAVNLLDEDATREFVDQMASDGFFPDALLNIAGGFEMTRAHDATSTNFDRMIQLNFKTLFHLTSAVIPLMKKKKDGFILGVSAEAGIIGGAEMGLYAASKAAVAVYLKSLQMELSGDGIRVSVLYPMDAINTEANRLAMPESDPADWLDPDVIATHILHLAEGKRRGHVRELHVHVG